MLVRTGWLDLRAPQERCGSFESFADQHKVELGPGSTGVAGTPTPCGPTERWPATCFCDGQDRQLVVFFTRCVERAEGPDGKCRLTFCTLGTDQWRMVSSWRAAVCATACSPEEFHRAKPLPVHCLKAGVRWLSRFLALVVPQTRLAYHFPKGWPPSVTVPFWNRVPSSCLTWLISKTNCTWSSFPFMVMTAFVFIHDPLGPPVKAK
jgi:hypothetical protein